MASRTLRALPPSGRRFVAVFAGVALCFIASTIYSQHVQRAIDRAAIHIASIAAPSIAHLAKASAELRRLQLLSRPYSPGEAAAAERARVEAVIASYGRFRSEVGAYLALPVFPDEREVWSAVSRDAERVDTAVGEIIARRGGRDAVEQARLEEDLTAAADQAAGSIGRAVEFHAGHAQRLAEDIEQIRTRSALIVGVLDGASAVLALVAALALLRTVRHYTSLLEAHGHLLEERADELEQFAGRVAHDVLSPLGSTAMALGMAERALPPGSGAQAAVARGQASLQRVRRIVDGLLEFARAGAKPAPEARAEVGPVIRDVVGELSARAEEGRVEVVVEPIPACEVACSPGILTSLLSNLLGNAIKHMGDAQERRVRVRTACRHGVVRIEIEDTGPGIPEELQTSIFEPFVRGRDAGAPGSGLGLATVNKIVRTHDGTVGVESSPGRGSTFWFELPVPAQGPGRSPA